MTGFEGSHSEHLCAYSDCAHLSQLHDIHALEVHHRTPLEAQQAQELIVILVMYLVTGTMECQASLARNSTIARGRSSTFFRKVLGRPRCELGRTVCRRYVVLGNLLLFGAHVDMPTVRKACSAQLSAIASAN